MSQLISTKQETVKARLELLRRWSEDAGAARDAFDSVKTDVAKVNGKAALFSCTYGRGIAAVLADGDVIAKGEDLSKLIEIEEDDSEANYQAALGSGFLHSSILGNVPPGAAPLNKVIDFGKSFPIPCGVCIILGPSNSGKTPLAHALAGAGVDSYSVVRAGEPFAGYLSNQTQIAKSLGQALFESSDVVLDSIKDLMSGDGAAMKGGLSRGVLLDLSIWSSLAASLGSTIYIPMNPSSTDPAIMSMLREAAIGNATMTISHSSATEWDFVTRHGEGVERSAGNISFARSKPGKSPRSAGAKEISASVTVVRDELADSVLNRVIRSNHSL